MPMSTNIGVGFSNKTDSFLSGYEAAEKACREGKITNPAFSIAFCSGKHDPKQFLAGIRSITGEALVVGGAAVGVFTNNDLAYEGFEGSVTVFASDKISFEVFKQAGIDIDEAASGAALANNISASCRGDEKALLVFYGTAKSANPPRLNFATPLFKSIEAGVPSSLTIAGSGLLGDMQLTTGFQFYNDEVLEQHVTAVLISGNCHLHTTIMHGCEPASSYKTITRTEGPVILEIENRPAVEMIEELLGPAGKIPWNEFALFITLGLNKGEKFGSFREVDYANRVCLAVDEKQKSIIMFEPDLKAGDEVQLMLRSINLDYIHKGITGLNSKATGKPLYYFYINCAGRAKPYSGGILEDVEEVQKLIGNTVPFMGFYSGVEVAKLSNQLQALDWTGVLCLLTEDE